MPDALISDSFPFAGVRQEQDIYVRLIDSVTKQVREKRRLADGTCENKQTFAVIHHWDDRPAATDADSASVILPPPQLNPKTIQSSLFGASSLHTSAQFDLSKRLMMSRARRSTEVGLGAVMRLREHALRIHASL